MITDRKLKVSTAQETNLKDLQSFNNKTAQTPSDLKQGECWLEKKNKKQEH